jgi:hypothetical protein
MLVEPSPTPTSGALHAQKGVGWQPSRLLTDWVEAERAYALAEQLGSVNAAATELGTTWPSLRNARSGAPRSSTPFASAREQLPDGLD